MLQIIDLENHELLTEISAKQSATISGGANSLGIHPSMLMTIIMLFAIMSNGQG